jgi:N-formylglutamate amidohydrolase
MSRHHIPVTQPVPARHSAVAGQPATCWHPISVRYQLRPLVCARALEVEDTDWHLDQLYAFVREHGRRADRAAGTRAS